MMAKKLVIGTLAALVVGAAVWATRPLSGDAFSNNGHGPLVQQTDDPATDDDLMRELMRRAGENGGRLELDQNDPLGRKLLERMQRGGGSPFGPGFDEMDRMMEEMFRRHRRPGPGNGFGESSDPFDKMFEDMFRGGPRFHFGPLPEDMRKQLEEMFDDDGMPMFPAPGGMSELMDRLERQDIDRKPGEHEKTHASEIQKYREVVAEARASTVRVLSDGKPVALGAVVDHQGHVLTKASQLKGDVTVQPADDAPREAKIVGVHEPFDLALLKVDGRGLTPVRWRRGGALPVGSLLATPGPDQDAVAVGVVSVAPRRPVEARGFLGVGHEMTEAGVQVTEVVPGTAASAAGIEVGDVIQKVDDIPIDTSMKLVEAVGNHKPGDKIVLQIQREGKSLRKEAALGTRQMAGARIQRYNFMDRMGSRLSERRDGFPYVLQHDSVLKPEHCGGPLVDLSGDAVGVNIARAGRVASYAVPAETVLGLLPELMSGKLAPPEPSVAEKLRQLDEALRTAEAAQSESETRAVRLQQEIERLKAQREKLLEQSRDER
jgi:serine protease Do